MAVYEGLLQRRLELWLNGAWVDFSDRLLTQTLSPNPGRTSGGNQVSPSTIVFSLDNPLGDITPYNATSAYYPHVDVGMLVRWSVFWNGNWYVRGVFEATDVAPHWPYGDLSDGTTTGQPGESYVAISVADILQRLSDNQQPLRSPLYRSMSGVAEGDYVPHAYWSMEDASGATQFASGVANAAAATFSGSVELAAGNDGLPGSDPLPTFGTGSSAVFPIAAYTNTNQWVLQFCLNVPSALAAETTLFTILSPGGTVVRWEVTLNPNLVFPPALDYRVRGYNSAGTALIDNSTTAETDTSAFAFYGNWVMASLMVYQSGGNVACRLNLGSPTRDAGGVVATTAGTHSALTSLRIPTLGSSLDGVGLGHVGVFTDPNFTITVDDVANSAAMDGWTGETAGRRIERLAREAGIAFTSAGDLDETTAMGPQPIDTLIAVFRDCESTDLGIFHAQRDANGVHYRTRADLYNQAPALVIDAAQNELANPFRPSATAKHIVNDVTVDRPGGSSARVVNQDSIDRVGQRPRRYSANTETDSQAAQVAGWLLNLGTPDGMHYPSVSSELTIATQIIDDWLALNLGDRIQVVNLPPQHPSGTVDLLVDGYTEPHSPGRWTPQINCSPAAPWDVAELDDDDLGKLDTDGSELITAVSSSATTLTVLTTNVDSPLWTTDSGEMPIPLIVAGEVMSVTDVDPAFSDAFGRVTASGWGTSDSGHAWTTTGGAAADYSTTGSRGQIAFTAAGLKQTQAGDSYDDLTIVGQVLPTEVSTGAPVDIGLTVRRNSSSNDCYELLVRFETSSVIAVRVNKVVAGAASNIAGTAVGTAYSAGSIFWIKAALQGDRIRVKAWNTSASEPDWHLDFTDSSVTAAGQIGAVCRVQGGNTNIPVSPQWDAIQVTNPQVMTVTRSVNGVAKSQSTGAADNVYRPARAAL